MKFSNIILAASILLLDTGCVEGKVPKPNKPNNPNKPNKPGKGEIDNVCTVDAIEGLTKVGKKVCMKTLGCAVDDNKVCVDFDATPCDDITNPGKGDCKKNGCVRNKGAGTCEVKPPDPCIAQCADNNNICCLQDCKCTNTKGKKCKKDNNCAFDKVTKVCASKAAGDTPIDKCSNLSEKKCNKEKKGGKKGCVYNEGSCIQCAANNGQATACDNLTGCVYNPCTEQCSGSKE